MTALFPFRSLQSIDPGQQFTWEHSNLEVNKPKNRYANVIAYDHSRVILLPIEGNCCGFCSCTLRAACCFGGVLGAVLHFRVRLVRSSVPFMSREAFL